MRTKEQINEYQKAWQAKNKEKLAAYKKKHYEENKESYKKRAQKFNKSPKRAEWIEANKESTIQYNKERWLVIKDTKPHLKATYGITLEDYNKMLSEQDEKCLGCEIHASELNHALHVDHCHKTGKIRGLLCRKCNTTLGLVNDNIDTLNNLIKYLTHG